MDFVCISLFCCLDIVVLLFCCFVVLLFCCFFVLLLCCSCFDVCFWSLGGFFGIGFGWLIMSFVLDPVSGCCTFYTFSFKCLQHCFELPLSFHMLATFTL